jgi:GH24 family phage-related lysozyme (muramidase)
MWLTDTDTARKLVASVLEVKTVRRIKRGEWPEAAKLSKEEEKCQGRMYLERLTTRRQLCVTFRNQK